MDLRQYILEKTAAAQATLPVMAALSTDVKNKTLMAMADALDAGCASILQANQKDLAMHPDATAALRRRLALNDANVKSIAQSLRDIAALPDPVGSIESLGKRPLGFELQRMRVPIGVIGAIFESRPNVVVEIAGLILKSGNACVLRGGKEALETNKAIVAVLQGALQSTKVPLVYLQFIDITDHDAVKVLCEDRDHVQLMIPRGGTTLIEAVRAAAKMPVLSHNKGICHVYVDDGADLDMALKILVNAKAQNPSVCNSAETFLIAASVAPRLLPPLIQQLDEKHVEVRGCGQTCKIVPHGTIPAAEEDWSTEYLDLIVSVKVVDSIDQAIAHIAKYSTHHSDAIVTNNAEHAERFVREVDSAAVLVNASTRLVDGGVFGLGAEVGISTDRTYDRGPMGVEALTVRKYVVLGNGQIRE
ncbi:glutamate-5-semialdehyde dehydrogenase [Candidatus Uhrbacteria bacterium]|nr:glutamate-5-semialdehyde dehydrogenase [Candidatus Uhrbacteria bacterium]